MKRFGRNLFALLLMIALSNFTLIARAAPLDSADGYFENAREVSLCRITSNPNGVNIRSGPSTLDPIIGTLEQGHQALVLGEVSNNWWPIKIPGAADQTHGWVAAWVSDEVSCEEERALTPKGEDCWISGGVESHLLIQGPADFLQGPYSPDKLGLLFQSVGKHVLNATVYPEVYLLFVDNFTEAQVVFPDWNYKNTGGFGFAQVSGCTVGQSVEPDAPNDTPVIVVMMYASIDPLEGFHTVIHEMSHAFGVGHGNWSENAYFWGLIGEMAYSGMCSVLDNNSPELSLCNDLMNILYS